MSKIAEVTPGPPKTLARSIAKTHEYMTEFHSNRDNRWDKFNKKFNSTFKRYPTKPQDFVWNVMDFARCSIVVSTPRDLLQVKNLIGKQLQIICIKNGYGSNQRVKGSGYRDMKL